MEKYIVTAAEINAFAGLDKMHFLNPQAQRNNKSLGDLVGLSGLGVHLIEVPPGSATSELHRHECEDEATYVLSGEAEVTIGDESFAVAAGDFIGYRAGGLPHTMKNTGSEPLRCLVVGQRLAHEVVDYPALEKRLYINPGQPWQLVDLQHIQYPQAGKKS